MRKKDIFIIILMVFTAILITIAGVYYQQSFLRILPLYVSLVISLLQTRISRFASLMGGINSLLYGAVYIYYSLYGSAFSALLFSFPIQILTFIRWNKNKWEHSTVLRKMSWKQRVVVLFGFIGALAAMWILLPLIGAKYVFLDSIINLLGILIYFLTMFAFVEYTFLMIINGVISIILYITMLSDSPEIATYLIYSVYSFICIVFAFFQAKRLYDTQQQK
ncbi:MAG: nicotinamide mononucleotide transporter [Clostridia bacterium]|nr:nicotinamide mononucleotide transporter [Clostridia bacterium]